MDGFMVAALRLTIWLVLLVALFVPLERCLALRPAHLLRPQTHVDLCWYFINSLVPAFLLSLPLAVAVRVLQGWNPLGLYGFAATAPLWLKLPLAFVVNDIGAYWMHRWSHANRFLWRFHAIHHSAEHVDWLVNTRAHPIDMVLVRLAGLIPVHLLGLGTSATGQPDLSVALVTVLGTIWSFFIHANVRCRLGPLEWLIATPAFHHWHHSRGEHANSNYAAVFPWLDRIFGTHYLPASHPLEYGIRGYVPPTLVGQLFDPLVRPQRHAAPRRRDARPGSDEGDAVT